MKKSVSKNFIYIISCIILYSLIACITFFFKISNDETQAMYQITGIALAVNFFSTLYIRNYLMYVFDIDRDDESTVDKVLNCIYSIIATLIVYLVMQLKNVTGDIPIMCSILYFIFSFASIWIASNINNGSKLYDLLSSKEKKLKYFIIPLIFALIWAIPVIVVALVFSHHLKAGGTDDTSLAILICPYIYAFLINYLFSKFNIIKLANDIDKFNNSPSGIIYYESFFNIFFIVVFVTMVFVRGVYGNDNVSSSNMLLATTFLLVAMVFYLIKEFSFDGFIGSGKTKKQKRISATTINYGSHYSTTEYTDEDGNKTTVDHWKF